MDIFGAITHHKQHNKMNNPIENKNENENNKAPITQDKTVHIIGFC